MNVDFGAKGEVVGIDIDIDIDNASRTLDLSTLETSTLPMHVLNAA